MKALIIGATGAVGKVLVRQLLCDDYFTEIVVFIRSEWDLNHPKLIAHIVDFDAIETWKHLIHGDVVFSCLGTTLKQAGSKLKQKHIDHDYVVQFAQYAKSHQVSNFILLSSRGASERSKFFYSQLKGKIEHAILSLRFSNTVIVRPSLMIRPGTDRMGEVISAKILRFFNRVGLFRGYKPIDVFQVASRMRIASKNDYCRRLIIENAEI
ncbi:NAD(P)H-binding protein [Myroides pelagicus]|uniref:NAD(P)H-binding protein n=1 Tax=Myroides pelagicus TaxID=270914 RepID=A0A7K1GLK3_9FLAO|nr:NAD(P)H-binding protein [Myroides pelagicus]MTH29696.1 NAD(P)H-binding protein [Myroides pelagicus]